MEAPPGIEPGMEVLQTSALPLGDGAELMRETERLSVQSEAHVVLTRRRSASMSTEIAPEAELTVKGQRSERRLAGCRGSRHSKLERETGFEPATSTLARSHSTTELFPPLPDT